MAKDGTGKRSSTTGSLRRADADVNRDKAIAKARAKVEKRRRQLNDATSALATLETTPIPARPPVAKAQANAAKAASKLAAAKAGAPNLVPAAKRDAARTRTGTAAARSAAKAGAANPSSTAAKAKGSKP